MTADEKEINATLRVVIKDVKEGVEVNKDWIIVRLKYCLNKVKTNF